MKQQTADAISKIQKVIYDALRYMNCSYTVDEDGNALPLIDQLSSGMTIESGLGEIEYIAESLAIDVANSLVSEDECVEGFHEWGTCECSNCIKANNQIAKRMIGLYQDGLPLLTTDEVVTKFNYAEEIKDWLDGE